MNLRKEGDGTMATKTKTLKRKEAFELEAPAASTVLLAGDFTGWQTEPITLKKGRNGRWKTTVPLEPGCYQYRFMVDGVWMDDPIAQARVPNDFGSQNCVREVASN
jgi:1,4-alpha-glucan branching enzyme